MSEPMSEPAPEPAPEPKDEAGDAAAPAPGPAMDAAMDPAPGPAPGPAPAPESSPAVQAEPWDPEILPADPASEAGAEPASGPSPAPEEAAPEPVPVVDSVVDSVEEPHEELHEEEAGWSLAARTLAVLCLLLAGAGFGIWAAPRIAPMLPSGMAPVARWLSPGQAETEAEIAALATKVDTGLGAIESRVAALPASADVESRIAAAVGDAQAKLSAEIEAEIEAARAAAGSLDLTAVNQKLATLEATLADQGTQLETLKAQIAGTAGKLSDEALGRIDAYKGEVEALRGEMASVRDSVTGFSTRLDAVQARAGREVEAAQAKVTEIRQQTETRLGAAAAEADLARIRAAIAAGQPFAQPLATLTGAGGATPPEGLSAAAESGVATLSSLRESYPDAAHAAIRASIMASAGNGVLARSRAFVEAQVSSRSLTPRTGQGTDAVLSRMEERLRQDDLDGLLAEAQQLPSEAAAAMGDWLAAARKRAAAIDGLATLDASLTKTN